jgi:adenylyltransferase/sulfurtransferase
LKERNVDYVQFCGTPQNDHTTRVTTSSIGLVPSVNIDEFAGYYKNNRTPYILLDVRDPLQFNIAALPSSINIPLRELRSDVEGTWKRIVCELEKSAIQTTNSNSPKQLFLVCRRGIDSLVAARALIASLEQKEYLTPSSMGNNMIIRNVEGGLVAWARNIDPAFPIY